MCETRVWYEYINASKQNKGDTKRTYCYTVYV